MANIFDRLARGPSALRQNDYQDWNQMVGSAPPERFGRSVYDAVRQVDPQDYYQHTQPGVGGTDPFGSLAPDQRSGLAQSIFGELTRRGMDPRQVSRGAGLGNVDPSRMSPAELAQLTQWMQREQPKAYGRVAAQYQDKPDILSSLLGNKALMMAVAGIGAKILSDRARRR